MKNFLKGKITLLILVVTATLAITINYSFKEQNQVPLTLKEFNTKVAREDKLVLVYFHASWCMVCEKVKPAIGEIEAVYSSKLGVLKVDTDKDKEVSEYFEIDALPVIMLYKKGIRQWIHVGMIDKTKLESKISPFLN
jgi:thioredoxin 1